MKTPEWSKIQNDICSHEKIKYIRSLPAGDTIFFLWIWLITAAGRANNGGRVSLTDKIPYTVASLAEAASIKKVSTVTLALRTFEELDMITLSNGFIYLNGWAEYQNTEALDEIQKKNRERQAKYRAKQKALAAECVTPGQVSFSDPECNVTCNVTGDVTSNGDNATKNKKENKEKEIESEEKKSKKESPPGDVTDAPGAQTARETWRQRIIDALAAGDIERAQRYAEFAQLMHYDLTVESIAAEMRVQKGAGA